jgi:heptosyltransferase-2
MLHALRRSAPQARVLAHGSGLALRLLGPEGLFDEALPLRKKGPLWPLREGPRAAAGGALDLALLLPNSFSAALVAWSAKAEARVGYDLGLRGPLLTHPLATKREGLLRPVPMVDYYLDLIRRTGGDVSGIPRRPVLTVTPAARAWAEAFLTRHGMNAPSARIWAINLGGSWETKRWIPSQAGALVRLLRARGIQPLLLRGPDEADLARQVVDAAGAPVPGAEEVVRLGELTAVAERCELLITTDSGPRHFGVAAGIPVLVLIGPTHPGYTTVDHPDQGLLCEQVACWPCHLKRCPVDFRCMRALTPRRVLGAGEALVERRVAREAAS